ncbi:MAG: restriction endonuclease subunit S [Methylococcales bacterium]|nr:restriction endonuclease subunit S [Methylococcales bacterium]
MSDIQPGYKQTEVGVIPEDWNVNAISDVAPLQRGFDLPTPQLRSGPFPVVYSNGVLHCHNKAVVTAPGVVTGRSGTIGKVNFIESDYWPHNTTLWVTSFKGNAPKFIYYLYQNIGLERFGTGSGVPTLNRNDVHSFSVPMPPVAEQEAIADALSDTDALIESLEQLITKKRHLKQGTMQQLLTGKKRLPGFQSQKRFKFCELGFIPDDWHCMQLPSLTDQGIGSIKIGPFGSALKKEYLTKDGYKVYGQENVYENNMDIGERFISSEHYKKLQSCEIKAGDFLISMMGTVGKCIIVPTGIKKGIMDSHLLRLRLNSGKLNSSFLAQLFETRIVFDQVKQLSVGGIMEGLSSKIIKSLNLPIPTIQEQLSIAEALSDMDTEITALETQLAKTRSLKQGMMHNLLSGRIRLL